MIRNENVNSTSYRGRGREGWSRRGTGWGQMPSSVTGAGWAVEVTPDGVPSWGPLKAPPRTSVRADSGTDMHSACADRQVLYKTLSRAPVTHTNIPPCTHRPEVHPHPTCTHAPNPAHPPSWIPPQPPVLFAPAAMTLCDLLDPSKAPSSALLPFLSQIHSWRIC